MTADLLGSVARMFARTDKQKWRDDRLLAGDYVRPVPAPKGSRTAARRREPPPLEDPAAVLGHPPRGRRR